MIGVSQFEQDPMRTRWQALDDDRFRAGMEPVPRAIVNRDMQMSDARRDLQRGLAIDRYDLQIFGPERDDGQSSGQRTGQRRADQQVRRSLRRGRRGDVSLMIFGTDARRQAYQGNQEGESCGARNHVNHPACWRRGNVSKCKH